MGDHDSTSLEENLIVATHQCAGMRVFILTASYITIITVVAGGGGGVGGYHITNEINSLRRLKLRSAIKELSVSYKGTLAAVCGHIMANRGSCSFKSVAYPPFGSVGIRRAVPR